MDQALERLQRYSWHQATVLLLVPYETLPEDVSVIIEQNYLVAGVRGQPAIIKGSLYASVDSANCGWQLEPRAPARGRTISSTSSRSSFAVVSDQDLSSFTVSLESGRESESEDYGDLLHSPVSTPSSNDESAGIAPRNRDDFVMPQISGFSSPHVGPSLTSSYSSTESLHHSERSGRLLTLHLEKTDSIIWPSLIIGPVPTSLSPIVFLPELWQDSDLGNSEDKYNMDPTSLSLVAVDMLDIRHDRVEAFEYFVRAWHQSRIPVSTLRLVTNYIPLQVSSTDPILRDSASYYINRLGGTSGQAQLYLQAGLLHLEGSASLLLSSSSTALSSLRSSEPFHHPTLRESGTETWRRDREAARRYFERAKLLDATLDVPILPDDSKETGNERAFGSPSVRSTPPSISAVSRASSRKDTPEKGENNIISKRRRRDKTPEKPMLEPVENDMWYLYLPGVVGAVIAVGVVGALSLTTWRKNQN
ncbi:hypothetical protein BU17DRAFT_41320 [Hysterangium stoloniferum]|nr:hypothetical protein BU17DRAFT_41320 [Hysterangium stoloniferum]